ncbi:MAG: mannose-6-phosphate isomerase, class I [Streptosporangiales bacterium]
MILRLQNPVRPYAWGSRTYLAELLGEASPAPGPQAELWLGAHPTAPSRVDGASLADLIAADGTAWLGPRVAAEFGGRLPFLLKVLAAEQPLSLQVHPSAAQAREGFARERAAGIGPDDPVRNYADDWPKPELVCALTGFDALCGFQPVPECVRLLDALVRNGATAVRPYADSLRESGDLRRLVVDLLTARGTGSAGLVGDIAAACRSAAASGEPSGAQSLAVRLAAHYPEDVGVLVAMLMNEVRLEPGDAMYLPAGTMHAYLHGAAVELMAASDNVLRGGLTGKHIDVPELARVLEVAPGPVSVLHPRGVGGEDVYDTPSPYFRLSRVVPGDEVRLAGDAPQIMLCVEGSADLSAGGDHVRLAKGSAAFVGAGAGVVNVACTGALFRATVPAEGDGGAR